MALQRLTDKNPKTDGITLAYLLHLVDTADTTDNAAGSSFKAALGDALKGFTFLKILGCAVLKFNVAPNYSLIQANDWVIWMDLVAERIVIGIAVDNITTIPTDLDDPLKFTKFFDGTELLP